jgi:lipoate-protein ligase B
VGYPILHLPSLRLGLTDYIAGLLDALVAALGKMGLTATASMERPGIWLGERKIGAVGVRLKERATYHGFALNVDTDLSWFDNIVACGLADVQTTSLAEEMDNPPTLEELGRLVGGALADGLGLSFEETRPI